MKKLKIILLFSITLITFIYVYYKNNNVKSIYDDSLTSVQGIVTDINYYDDKISFIIKNKESILVNDYNLISDIKLGDYVSLTGTMKSPQGNTNFNLFNYKNYLLSKKIHHTFTLDTISVTSNSNIFYKLKNKIIDRLDDIDNSYLYTFILADNRIDDEVYDTYQINGISHLFAISGMQITLLSIIMLFLLNKFIKRRKISYVIVSLLLILFMFLTGFTASVVRSCLIFIFITIFKLFNIKIKTLYTLYLVLIVLLLYNPYYIYDIGFIYSFTISFSLLLLSKNISNYNNYFIKLFIISLIAFIVSIPITINNNFSINLLSPFLNLIFVPFVTFIITPISIITLFIPSINDIFIIFIDILEYLSVLFLKYQIEFIYCHIPIYGVIIYYLIIGLIFYKPNKITISIFIILLCFHYNIKLFNKYPVFTMLDIGQGDSFLIELPHNKGNILIDTGGNLNYDIAKNIVIPFIKSRGIRQIDYLILSHGDYDHMGASIELVNNFKVNKVIMNNGEYNELETELIKILDKKNIKYLKELNELNIGTYKLHFLNTKKYYDENDNSNVVYFNYNNYKFLFMGDAGVEREKNILDTYNLKDIDFLKVGHHGSNTSSSEYFIESISPKYSFISVGKNNRYGHPKDEVLETLSKSKIYRTDIDGSIEIKLNENGYIVRTCTP